VKRPVVYLLPGLLCDGTVWASQVESLSSAYDVRVADFRSFDRITAMAESVLAEAPRHFSVAGHSMGARAALEIVRLAPDRVERLALLDTGTHTRRPGEAEKRQALVDLAQAKGMSALADEWLPPMVHRSQPADGAVMAALRAMVEAMSPDIFERQVRALLDRPDAEAGLSAIRCPVLIGVGADDAWSPPSQHQAMASHIPHATFTIFPDSGHMAPIEAPEAVTAALARWLAAPATLAA
jgi:pimeloyl-ACP methyl ester carboxylesterase